MKAQTEQHVLAQVDEYLQMIRQHLWWVVLGTVILSSIFFTVVALLPDQYEAMTTILVDPQKIPERYVSSTVSSDLSQRLSTITQEVLSSTRLQQIIDRFKLYAEMKNQSREEVIAMMRKDINIQVRQGSAAGLSAFTITYEGRDPKTVAQVTDQLASSFIEWNLKSREQVATGTTEFLQSQLEEAKRSLEEQERKVRQFRLQHVGEMPDQQQANLQNLGQLQATFQANADALNRLEMERTLLLHTGETEGHPTNVARPLTERGRLEAEKRDLESQLFELRRRYTPVHPEVLDLAARLDRVNAVLKTLPPDTQETVLTDRPAAGVRLQIIDREMKRLTREQSALTEQISMYRRRTEAAPVREQQMAELNRNYQVSQEHYRSLLDKTYSASMAAELEHSQQGEHFTVLDPAQVPEKPIKPHRKLMFPAAFMLALVLSGGCAIARELLHPGIRSQQQLKTMLPPDVQLLCAVPEITTLPERRRKVRMAIATVTLSVLLCVIEAGVLWKIHPNLS